MAASGPFEVPEPWREIQSSHPALHSSFLGGSHGAHVGKLKSTTIGGNMYKTTIVNNHHESTRENKESDVPVAKIAQWLNAPNFMDPYRKALAQRMPNTGLWFFELRQFRQLVSEKGVVIWATGMPGSGKTVLSSASAQRLQETFKDHQDVATVFTLIQYDDRLETRDILASFLTQLLDQRHLIQGLMEFEYNSSKAIPLNVQEMSGVLRRVMKPLSKLFVVIDGLDEAADDVKDELLDELGSLPANILLTSRPMDLFSKSHLPNALHVTIEAHSEDIEAFVEGRIKKNSRLRSILGGKPELIQKLKSRIKATSWGMFLVARLQMDAVRNCRSVNDLFKKLDSVPSGLDDMYRHTLQRILSQEEEDVGIASRVFFWLLHAFVPLSPDELQEALAVSFEDRSFDPGDIVPINVILSVCCGLVEVTKTAVRFIHYTAQEYIKAASFDALPGPPSPFLATTCLVYLTWHLTSLETSESSTEPETFQFAPYAYKYVAKHAQESQGDENHDSLSFSLPEDHASLPTLLGNLGRSLRQRFEQTGDLSDIDESISAQQKAMAIASEGRGDLVTQLSSLGATLLQRFEHTGILSDVTEAITTYWRMLALTPDDQPDIPALTNLGLSLFRRFERTGNPSDIAEAISLQAKVLDLTPDGHTDLPSRLTTLGSSLLSRYELTGELSDLYESISAHQKAVEITPEDHPYLPSFLSDLGVSYARRFERTGDLSDSAEAISAQTKAVNLTPSGHADLPARLTVLGSSFVLRFERTGDPSDIAEAISIHQRAVELTPPGHPHLHSRLNNLGRALIRRFEHIGDISDITDAMRVQQKAVELTAEGHPDLPALLTNLGNVFMGRFARSGDSADLTEAIAIRRKAIQLTPQGHTGLPSRLNTLGRSLLSRYRLTGELSDIYEAIAVHQKAIQLIPHDHSHLPALLSNLGVAFSCRFERTGKLSDCAEAISTQESAVSLTPNGHANMPARLTALGNSYALRFEHTGDLSNIAQAIAVHQRAVELTPLGHPRLPSRLNDLGTALTQRFEHSGDSSDIISAMAAQQRAVQLSPEGHPELPVILSNLGDVFRCSFERSPDLSYVEEAIASYQKAIQRTPSGHPHYPSRMNALGRALLTRFASSANRDDLDQSISHFKLATMCNLGPPQSRLKAAKNWTQALHQHDPESLEIIPAFDAALSLVAIIAGLEQNVQSRSDQLKGISGLAVHAASIACLHSRPDKALEWLEQGRCLVWSQLNHLRTPLDDLRLHDAELAERIADTAKQLEWAGVSRTASHLDMSLSEKISVEEESRAHLDLAREWDDLLHRARAIPGFENFLEAPPCAALLQHLPDSGPIVVVNVHETRCDAIALLAGEAEPIHIPLPNFTLVKANIHWSDLGERLRFFGHRGVRPRRRASEEHTGQDVLHGILLGLWVDVVKPILQALGFSRRALSSGKALPRVWWCPTGVMSFLPIHAAGNYYGRRNPESILDYVVSSYTPTVTMLTDRVRNSRPIEMSVAGLFMTSQPNAHNMFSIPGTTTEVRSVFSKAQTNGARVRMADGDELTIDECLKQMEDFSCIHLACHASQNASDPFQSRFLFNNGYLDLATIIQKNLKNADLAFLSASQTSTGEEQLSDEAVHLASGMLVAGYRRVVATMWSIDDRAACEVANDFYDYLWSHGEGDGCVDGTQSAYALHHAIQQLRLRRDDSEQSLLTWVPYVHFGY
ncbi:CHAT domain-containing protein [Ephemerocybe angulata]|uniref:CHAT domain-containing protein n=1 Tax=Ephemerocybe angulata TaxID=980116 RepID=A0A8H6I735_9AGAR|nr:CHAT domain-containing protein [Tulosesus angulatus]